MELKKIILDTDIGDDIDDAFALNLILHSPEIELLGITTVFKNTEMRARIAKKQLQTFNREDIEVYAGIDKPLNQDIIVWPYETIMANGKVRIQHFLEDMASFAYNPIPAVEYILNELSNHPYEITLLAIGPLTNLATAYLKDKEKFLLAKEIVLMGGQLGGTYPEWNIKVDPEAAQIVFQSGLPIRAVGINVTRKCTLCPELLSYLRTLQTEKNQLVVQMMEIWMHDNPSKIPTMHDPLAVACLIDDFCVFENHYIKVETLGEKRAYTLSVEKDVPNVGLVQMASEVNVDRFMNFLKTRIID